MSDRIKRNERKRFLGKLTPGDHIASVRKGEIYEHHGIFEGGDRIVHFQGPSKGREQHTCKNCEYCPSQAGGIVRTCFTCFCLRESCFIIRYKNHDEKDMDFSIMDNLVPGKAIQGYKSNKIYLELYLLDGRPYGHMRISKGERSKFEFDSQVKLSKFSSSKSAEEVLRTASIASHRFRNYSLLLSNCEDFAVFCKTNKPESIQVEKKFMRYGPLGIGKLVYKTAKIMHRDRLKRRKKKELLERLARATSVKESSTEGPDADERERENRSVALLHKDDEIQGKSDGGSNLAGGNNLAVNELDSYSKNPLPNKAIQRQDIKITKFPELKRMNHVSGDDGISSNNGKPILKTQAYIITKPLKKPTHKYSHGRDDIQREDQQSEYAKTFQQTTNRSDSDSEQTDMEEMFTTLKSEPAGGINYRQRIRVLETDSLRRRSSNDATSDSMRQDINSIARSLREVRREINYSVNFIMLLFAVLFWLVWSQF